MQGVDCILVKSRVLNNFLYACLSAPHICKSHKIINGYIEIAGQFYKAVKPRLCRVAGVLAQLLGIGVNSAYDLVHAEGFPAIWVSPRRCVIPADGLRRWLDERSADGNAGTAGKNGGRLGVT